MKPGNTVCLFKLQSEQRTVWDVNASWDSAPGESEDVQRGEVRFEERVFLKVLGPGQLGEQDLCRTHQLGKTFAHRLVHHRNKAYTSQHTGS